MGAPIKISAGFHGVCPGGSVVEHVLGKDEVTGSIPVLGSMLKWLMFARLAVA
jgi:hypothetical protein